MAAARRMIAQGVAGAIVNIASNAGKVGYPDMAAYNASKAAVINLTRSLAAEWAPHRINVNAVCPGGVQTPMLAAVAEWITARQGGDAAQAPGPDGPGAARPARPAHRGRARGRVPALPAGRDHPGQAINVDGGDTPY